MVVNAELSTFPIHLLSESEKQVVLSTGREMQTLDMRISIFNTIYKITHGYATRLPHNKPLEEFRCVHIAEKAV